MALVKSFGFTNTKVNENVTVLKPVDINPVTDYAERVNSSDDCQYVNNSSPIDQSEVISFKTADLKQVNQPQTNLYPPTVPAATQFVVKVDELLSVTDDNNADYRVDLPISAYLTVRFNKSGQISADDLQVVVNRLIGMMYKDDGSSRIPELMRQCIRPTSN